MATDLRRAAGPAVPVARGELSAALLSRLVRGAGSLPPVPVDSDPYGDDLQLALYACYELHYRGFAGVADDEEWDPAVLAFRRELEGHFLWALRAEVQGGDDVDAAVAGLLVEPPDQTGVSHHLQRAGTLSQAQDYVTHRSLYHLKEADPQAWVIPRLDGAVKAAVVSVEHDEYGAGRPERMHAALFGDLMVAVGLSPQYGAYLDVAPAATLAEVNAMSLFGLHRALRGALIGQFAAVELTSSPGSARLVRAFTRLGCPPAAAAFYAEHVEADAVHEQLIRTRVLRPLLAAEPHLARDVVFGIQAAGLLADRWAQMVLAAWAVGRSSLR